MLPDVKYNTLLQIMFIYLPPENAKNASVIFDETGIVRSRSDDRVSV